MDNDDGSEREFSEMEAECGILERVAEQYSPDSSEAAVLRRAAFALSFSVLRHNDEFQEFLEKVRRPLTPSEEDRIRRMNWDHDK